MEKKKLIPRELLKQFIKENNLKTAEDAKDLVKDLFADTIQGSGSIAGTMAHFSPYYPLIDSRHVIAKATGIVTDHRYIVASGGKFMGIDLARRHWNERQ